MGPLSDASAMLRAGSIGTRANGQKITMGISDSIRVPHFPLRHCHVNRVGPQRPAWIPFQAAALAFSHTLNVSFRNRLNVSLLRK